MFLRPDGGHSRSGRSRSRSRDDRVSQRSHSAIRSEAGHEKAAKPSKSLSKSARFVDHDEGGNDDSPSIAMPAMPGSFNDTSTPTRDTEIRRPPKKSSRRDADEDISDGDSDSGSESYFQGQANRSHGRGFSGDVRFPSSAEPPRSSRSSRHADGLAYGDSSSDKAMTGIPYPDGDDFDLPEDDTPISSRARMPSISGYFGYANPEPYKYAEAPENVTYTAKPGTAKDYRHTAEPISPKTPSRNVSFSHEPLVHRKKHDDDRRSSRSGKLSVEEPRLEVRAPTANGRRESKSNLLSVGTNRLDDRDSHKGSKPPPSPLLEPYHGTYQSLSPMPSPILLPKSEDAERSDSSDSISSEDLDADDVKSISRAKQKLKLESGTKKRVKLYDAEGDAEKIAAALHHQEARPSPLIDILPELTHDQLLALRNEYKKHVKVQGRGVNIAKQIKAATSGNFSKVCYATALGRWESEAYWANFWYQAHSSNRELLIEALMGRSNADIREIKEGFRDKRYHDDLSLCMQKELKPDKFRMAVLLALEGDRQEETDVWPAKERRRDVETLYRALKSREGGESAIVEIVVTRSINHLREILTAFEKDYHENFPRAALKKSTNLVGEVIAHILNGVINRPARDCMLLRHAINDVTSKEGDLRYELLMSRLIRLHWDRTHLQKVKDEYKLKYGESLERGVKKATKGDFGAFCVRLCET